MGEKYFCGGPTPCSPTTDIGGCPYANDVIDVKEFYQESLVKELMTGNEIFTASGEWDCNDCPHYQNLSDVNKIREILDLETLTV
tara:strand:+ start:398 stop:652 length:255 start_codon:yes stop_codon:yes gene_type:complete